MPPRRLRRLPLVLAVALAASGAARGDTVVLRDGRVISGRVIEQGDKIFIEHDRHGGITVLRSDVVRIEGAADAPAAAAATVDTVVLTDGRIVRGDARLSADGAEVIVGLGERGEVRTPRAAVAVIQWRDGRAEAAGPDGSNARLTETIDRRLRDLGGRDPALVAEARRELLALGAFSRAYLQQAAEKLPESVELQGVLRDLDRLEAWRKVLPARVEETVPHLGERLVSADQAEREAALRAVVLEAPPASAGPVLLHAVRTDDHPRVRAYAVSALASLRRYEDLAEVLKVGDGPLRLAAAFALGDAGIYAGVPILIEALRLSDLELRAAAIRKLTEYTGQHFGYRPQGTAEDREKAIARWNQWWNENGDELVRRSIKAVAPNAEGSTVTSAEREQALKLWADANTLLAEPAPSAGGPPDEARAAQAAARRRENLERAQDLLRQALDLDPSLGSARMTRAVLLYEELARPRDAERQLNIIIARAEQAPEGTTAAAEATAAKKFALFHLGQIALRDGQFERAQSRFAQAADLDPTFVEGLEAQGDAHLGLALSPPGPDGKPAVEQRREALAAARVDLRKALERLSALDAELATMSRDIVADSPSSLQEGQVIQSVRRSREALRRRVAAAHFKLGRVAAALGEDAAALEAYRVAARTDPDAPAYQQAVEAWERLVPGPAAPPAPPAPR